MRKLLPVAVLLLLLPVVAHAQGFTAGTIDAVLSKFQSSMSAWEPKLEALARGTFGILALISLAIALIRAAFRQEDFSGFMATLIHQIFYLGIFYWLLETTSTWGPLIINSFRQAASNATGTAIMHPGDVFNSGWSIAKTVLAQMSVWDPAQSVALMIAGILIMGVFAWICAEMVVTLIQSYFIIAAGVLFMAFGGVSYTSEIAVAVLRQTFAIGAKLFSQICIVALGMDFLTQAAAAFGDFNAQGMLALIGVALVLLTLTLKLPAMVERMFGGIGFAGTGELLGTTAAAAGAAMTAGRSAAVGVRATGGAVAGAARWGTGGSLSSGSQGGGSTLSSRFSSREPRR